MSDLLAFTIRTVSGDTIRLECDRIKVTGRGDPICVVGGFDTDDDSRARAVLALPTGTWSSVGDDDFADVPAIPLARKFQ